MAANIQNGCLWYDNASCYLNTYLKVHCQIEFRITVNHFLWIAVFIVQLYAIIKITENSKMAAEIQNCHFFWKYSVFCDIYEFYVSLNHKSYSKSLILNCSDNCAIEMIKNFKMVANEQNF